MATMGRPKKDIDEEQFKKLCSLQCTQLEIASFFDITDDTLNRWCKEKYGTTFSDTYKRYSVNGKISLRRTQFRIAERSATMAIFLGKQYLNQRDYPDEPDGNNLIALNKIVSAIKGGENNE